MKNQHVIHHTHTVQLQLTESEQSEEMNNVCVITRNHFFPDVSTGFV